MIAQNDVRWERPWQTVLKEVISSPEELLEALDLNPQEWLAPARRASELFSLRVPRGFVARMQPGDPNDPLLRQVLPLDAEHIETPGYQADPVNEAAVNPVPGLIHKYRGRVLLTLTSACAVNCRFCFRRHFPYQDNQLSRRALGPILDYIQADSNIHEVILSGGDPLVANDNTLQSIVTALAAIPHVTTLRLHTRLPIVLPERITTELLNVLTATRLKPVIVLHSNHAQEWDNAVAQAMQALRARGVVLLNQSVLLKGVNDSAAALINLSETLLHHGVVPYYLHLLDKVQGAAHFDVAEEKGQALIAEMTKQLPGYLVPRLVREVAGLPAKQLVSV